MNLLIRFRRRLQSSPARSHENPILELSRVGPPWTVRCLTELIKLHRPGLVFLSETKCKARRCDRITAAVNYYGIGVDSIGKGADCFCYGARIWTSGYNLILVIILTQRSSLIVVRTCGGLLVFMDIQKCARERRLGTVEETHLEGETTIAPERKKHRFRFEAAWTSNAACSDIILHAWSMVNVISPSQSIIDKIRATRIHLRKWDSEVFGNIHQQTRELNDKIYALHNATISTEAKANIEAMRDTLEDLVGKKEVMWKQRAKAYWLKLGDHNSRFFHAKANERRTRKEVKKMKDEAEVEVQNKVGIQGVVTRYFQSMFASTNLTLEAIDNALMGLDSCITHAMNESFLQPFTPEEIKLALKDIDPLNSPGPDANRIKPFLDSIISKSQAIFVPGFLITDNVLTAFELNHCLKHKTKGKKGYVSLKLDISKAYDRVEWGFLERVLIRGFHSNFINLIMLCVSSVPFSFLLNGEQFGFLRPERGLRQGDPLSPYLFLFCAEALSASTKGLTCVRNILTIFGKASGLKINLLKSDMVVSWSVEVNKKEELAKILGVEVVARHDKYLGLPALAGRSKRELFEGIKDRFWSKLNNWAAKQLSQAGCAFLIKTILQTIPTYAISCFHLPDSVLGELERILADFFWQGSIESKIHWLAWSKLCIPKAQGSLGFRRLKEFNLALLTKQAWRISIYPKSLPHQILSQKYFLGLTFFEARLGAWPSYTWRSVWETRDILAAGSDGKWGMEDADCILSVKPRGPEVRDELIWHFEAKGCFSVKSAYMLATELHEEGSSSQRTSNWKFVWKSKAPPKVVVCMEVCSKSSPHSREFKAYARLVWALSGLPWAVVGVSSPGVEDWFNRVHRMLEKDEWGLFLSICWGLWWARNLRMFEGRTVEAQTVIRMARRTIEAADSHSFESRTGAAVFSLIFRSS
ncbi:UNVERIFIED_CONTAM: hypothetical protein Sradi_5236500 [Sesamum radiatum]|uniref:Reverse transcriptase domain-containing protein n=1 Tax=Sesamum radiatum TaxID=300843 RepID=A0AAW2LN31_SESRA